MKYLCGDFKATLNLVLAAEQYPRPLIDDLLAGLGGGQMFRKAPSSSTDECGGAITNTHKGLFRYRLPFGFASAPALFQQARVGCRDDILCMEAYDEEARLDKARFIV